MVKAQFKIYFYYQGANCKKCSSSLPTLIKDFPTIPIEIVLHKNEFEDFNDLIKENKTVSCNTNEEILKKFSKYSTTQIIFFDTLTNTEIYSINALSYFDKREPILNLFRHNSYLRSYTINNTEINNYFHKNDEIYYQFSDSIAYKNLNSNSSYVVILDSAFCQFVDSMSIVKEYSYLENYKIRENIPKKLKYSIPNQIVFGGGTFFKDKFYLSLFINEFKRNNNSLTIGGSHYLFLILDSSGINDIYYYPLIKGKNPELEYFKYSNNQLLAPIQFEKKPRKWNKNLVLLTLDSSNHQINLNKAIRDKTFSRFIGKIKNKDLGFEGLDFKDDYIIYYFAGYFSKLNGMYPMSTIKEGNLIKDLNKVSSLKDNGFNNLTIYSNYYKDDKREFIVESNQFGKKLIIEDTKTNERMVLYLAGTFENVQVTFEGAPCLVTISVFDPFSKNLQVREIRFE